jgi:hypothetical protein
MKLMLPSSAHSGSLRRPQRDNVSISKTKSVTEGSHPYPKTSRDFNPAGFQMQEARLAPAMQMFLFWKD